MTERITLRDEPNQFDGVYENDFAEHVTSNTFLEKGESKTLWVLETEFKFKTLTMKIVGPLMKKNFVTRTQKDMEWFKELAESL